MPERRHGAAFDQVHVRALRRPPRITAEGKLRAPAELARRRLEPVFERAPQARLGANAAHQHYFATWLEHARELIEGRFRIGHGGDDILRHNDVE